MRSLFFARWDRSWCAVLVPAVMLVTTGCGDSEVKTYRVAKEDNTPKVPAVHSEDDGHGHGAGGHGMGTGMAANVPNVTWELPAGWQALPTDGMRKGIFQVQGPDGKMAQVMVIPLPGVSNIELQSVNMWREELGLDQLNQEQMTAQAQPVEVGDAKGELFDMVNAEPRAGQKFKTRTIGAIAERENVLWFAKMTGADDLVAEQKKAFVDFLKSLKFEKPEVAQAAVSTNTRELPPDSEAPKWKVPSNWQQKAPGPMITAAYTVSGAQGPAEVTVSKFPGDVGGMLANVNRWRDQLQLEHVSAGDLQKSVEMVEIDGKKNAYLVDLKGTSARSGKPTRMVALGVPRGGETWFYKLTGDDATVGAEKDAFLKFVVGAY